MSAKSRVRSLYGRDIAPIPCVVDSNRRNQCRYDLRRFLSTYYARKFNVPFCDLHLLYIGKLQDVIFNGGNLAIAMPRGIGKTAIEKGACVWATVYGHKRFVIIVTATKSESIDFLDDVRSSLCSALIREDFPEISYPLEKLGRSALLARGQMCYGQPTNVIWQSNKIVLPNIKGSWAAGSILYSTSMSSAVRGKSLELPTGENVRPDLLLIDDPQKDADAINPKRVEKLEDNVKKALKGLFEDGHTGTIVITGTCMEPGDFMDRVLDHNIYPTYRGIKTSMIPKMPDRMDIWLGPYADLWRNDPNDANRFYQEHRDEMDAGSIVDWPERYDPNHEISRLQRGMNLLLEDEDSFWSERQNEPRGKKKDSIVVDPKTIRSRLNGYDRYVVPVGADTLTAFLDVHADVLYFVVCAFRDDRTGFIIDYGTFPEQRRDYFFKGDSGNETLKQAFPGMESEGAIQEGVLASIRQILGETYLSEEGHACNIAKLMIDAGYKRTQVENAIRLSESPIPVPSKGRGIKSGSKPISEYRREFGDKIGHFWILQHTKGRSYKTTFFDTNYWKSEVHNAFALGVGDIASLSLWGNRSERHRMFSEHLYAENVVLTKSGDREVYEWQQIPGRDNHLFDGVVGCLVAASILGIRKPNEQ